MRRARVALSLAAMLSCVSLASCGGGDGSSVAGATGGSRASHQLAFANCMRANGLPNFPDLGSNGLLIEASGQTLTVNGVSVNAPAFAAARSKCQKYLPTHIGPSVSQPHALARTLNFARCMRGHGVPNFPDPKVTAGSRGNSVVDLRGAGLNFQSPAFVAASKACGGGPKGPK